MIDYAKIDQAKLVKADKVSEIVKQKFNLSYIRICLNMLNDDINVELKHNEISKSVLDSLKENFDRVYQNKYKIKPIPVLSGSYIDSTENKTKILYNFEKL